MDDIRLAADRSGVSLTNFVVQAATEKVVALKAQGKLQPLSPEEQRAYFEARASRATPDTLREVLARTGTTEAVLPGDEIPADWLVPAKPGDASTVQVAPTKPEQAK